jgi:LysM repeat protein
MSGIAAKNHMSLAALAKLNPQVKNLSLIHVGQVIHLRAPTKPRVSTKSKTYTVKSGDTFGGIAAKYDMSTAALAKLNPQVKNLNLIHPGEKLVVKKSAAPAPTPSAPTPTPSQPNPTPTPTPSGALPKVVPNTKGLSTAKRYALYERYIAKHGDAQAKKDLAAGKRVILALRKDTPMSSGPYEGTYDDRIVVLWKDRSGPHVQELLANTEPNRRWAQPANASSKPVGRLADNQTIRYHKAWSSTFGNHLEPYGNPYAQRDLNRNYKFDKGERSYNGDWGGQAMFIHRAWATNTGSQGCQTMEEGRFNTFWRALGGQKDFSYVLVNVAKA